MGECKELCTVVNRLGGIIIWVGLWNLICIVVKENDVIGNILLSILGLGLWAATGEFREQNSYVELNGTLPLSNAEDIEV